MNPKLTVARAYDHIAEGFFAKRSAKAEERIRPYLDRVAERLQSGASVLDAGCGAGVPAAYLSPRFDVIGLDISRRQLELARRQTPDIRPLLADMTSLPFRPASFDAIVALYSVIHVPREEHEPLLLTLRALLRPGGRLLVTLGAQEWEGREQDWLDLGAEMFWSHYAPDAYREMVERTGFRILAFNVEPDDELDGAHLLVVAERPN